MRPAKLRLRSKKFDQNITKRGKVEKTSKPKTEGSPVGPVLLVFFIFVVVGSAILQIISTAQRGNPLVQD